MNDMPCRITQDDARFDYDDLCDDKPTPPLTEQDRPWDYEDPIDGDE
jgi:hypothetical protein